MSCGHISRSLDHPYPRSHNAGILRSVFCHWCLIPLLSKHLWGCFGRFQSNANPSRSTRFSESLDGLDLSFPRKLPVLVRQTLGGYANTQRGVLGRSSFRDGTSHRLPKHEGILSTMVDGCSEMCQLWLLCYNHFATPVDVKTLCQGFGPHRSQARGGKQSGWVWWNQWSQQKVKSSWGFSRWRMESWNLDIKFSVCFFFEALLHSLRRRRCCLMEPYCLSLFPSLNWIGGTSLPIGKSRMCRRSGYKVCSEGLLISGKCETAMQVEDWI